MLTEAQRRALTTDERALEELPFRERDDLIAKGLARRAWPEKTGDRQWHTWLTPAGVRERLRLVGGKPYPSSFDRRAALSDPQEKP